MKPDFYFRVHKDPLPFPILSQINPIHTTSSYLSKIHFNIILPPMFLSLVVSSLNIGIVSRLCQKFFLPDPF
jgi:hypothetical protein